MAAPAAWAISSERPTPASFSVLAWLPFKGSVCAAACQTQAWAVGVASGARQAAYEQAALGGPEPGCLCADSCATCPWCTWTTRAPPP